MDFKGKKVIVTGSSGFIGKNISLKLLELGAVVIGIYNSTTPNIVNKNFYPIKIDLLNRIETKIKLVGAQYMVMCAAYVGGAEKLLNDPMNFVIDKTFMDLNTLESAYLNDIRNIVYISSGMCYEEKHIPLTEEMAMDGEPWDKYFFGGWSRRYTEAVCKMYAEKIKNPINITSIRIDNIYGPYDSFDLNKSHVMAALIKKAIDRMDPFEVWGDGKDYKDFIYIDDLVDGVILALGKTSGYNLYNIASGKNYTINEVLSMILKITNYTEANIIYNKNKPMMIPYKVLSINKAKEELGFKPQTSIEVGIKKTVQWYLNNN